MADVSVELFYSGVWNPAPCYIRDGLRITRGLAEDSLEAKPTTAPATLDNRDGSKNPNNPTSPLYGLVGRNTPMRVLIDGDVRASVEVADWQLDHSVEPVDVEKGRGDAWAKVQGAGILRRLGQGASPLRSPAYRALLLSTTNRVAWWPLEDGPGATVSASPIGSPPARPFGVATKPPQFGAFTGSPAAERMVTMGDNDLQCVVPPYSGSEHKVVGLVHVPWDDATFNGRLLLRIDCTNVRFELVWGNAGSLNLECRTRSGTLISSTGAVTFGLQGFEAQVIFEFEQIGADVFSTTRVVPTAGGDGASNVFTFTSVTMGRIESIRLTGETASWGHVAVGNDVFAFNDEFLLLSGYRAMQGWVGEEAGSRFMRLCDEEGITAVMVGNQFDTQAMGPQPVAKLVDILQECARTDAGMMYELRTLLGLRFRTGRNLTNQDPVLTLDYGAQQVAPPFLPTVGDYGTRNDVTAEDRRGSKHNAVLATGAMSTQAPPNGVGKYDTRLPVNVFDIGNQLPAVANWHLGKGTVDETRFRSVTVDLDAPSITPAIVAAVNSINVGDVIAVNNLLPADSYDPARLIVTAVEEMVRPKGGRLVTFSTVPASPYEVAVIGANDGSTNLRGQAIDTDKSTLTANVGAAQPGTSMTFQVTSTGGVVWTTDANDWDTARNGTSILGAGLFIRIGGEDMRVTNITGASSPQTFTVLRGQNGVVKSHLAGAPVHVRFPVRIGL